MPISMYFPTGPERILKQQPVKHPDPTLPPEDLDTEFKRDYPPDVFGHEVDDAARVWKVYRTHATAHDDTLLEGWNATLDILLIFAGLFSAVVTAFLIESYQTLQFDNDAYIVTALYALVSANTVAAGVAGLPRPPTFSISPSRATRWINGLWFISLLLALSVSLLSILVKQWLREYKARNTAPAQSPKHWSLRRAFLLQALVDYPIGGLISVLPLFLHLALFFFLAGAVAFLWDLDRATAVLFAVITCALGAFYLTSIAIPLAHPECPTSTPIVNLIRFPYFWCILALLGVGNRLSTWARRSGNKLMNISAYRLRPGRALISKARRLITSAFVRVGLLDRASLQQDNLNVWTPYAPNRLQTAIAMSSHALSRFLFRASNWNSGFVRRALSISLERRTSDTTFIRLQCVRNEDNLTVAALKWLITVVTDGDAVAVGIQALGSLPSSSVKLLRDMKVTEEFPWGRSLTVTRGEPGQIEIARILRAMCAMGSKVTPHAVEGLALSTYPDFVLLFRCFFARDPYELPDFEWNSSPTLMRTTLLVLAGSHRGDDISCLKYCRLPSFSMCDWELVLAFTEAAYSSLKPEIPSGIRLDIVIALHVLRCTTHDLLRPGHRRGSGERKRDLVCVSLQLMACLTPTFGFGLFGLFADAKKSNSIWNRIPGVMQDVCLALITVLSSEAFLVDIQSQEDVRTALNFLARLVEVYLHSKEYGRVRLAIHAWAVVEQRFAYDTESTPYDAVLDAAEENIHEPEYADILALVLLPVHDKDNTTVWQVVSHCVPNKFAWIITAARLSITLRQLDPSSPRYSTLVDAFLEHLNFAHMLRLGIISDFDIVYGVSWYYRTVRPSVWQTDMAEAETYTGYRFKSRLAEVRRELENEDPQKLLEWACVVDCTVHSRRDVDSSYVVSDESDEGEALSEGAVRRIFGTVTHAAGRFIREMGRSIGVLSLCGTVTAGQTTSTNLA